MTQRNLNSKSLNKKSEVKLQRIGQRIINDILGDDKVDISIYPDSTASMSCPYLFYMSDAEFREKYLEGGK